MNNELWVQIEQAYSEVAELPPNARTAFLEMTYRTQPEIRKEVEELLSYQEAAQQISPSTVAITAAEMFEEGEGLIGEIIADRYLVRQCLGTGGMAQVYLADHIALKMSFALKRPLPALRFDPEFRKRFLEEARRAVILKHENVARVHDVIETGDDMFVVMEYIEGETLERRLADLDRPFTIEEFLPIAVQCAAALVAAHEKRIVHLDVKPANIMLTPTGQVKICDFGVARRLSSDTSNTTTMSDSRWALAGTPAYMAPEVILNSNFDERADLFSLGTVFYEMLTGKNPFRADTTIATTAKVVSEDPPAISKIEPDFDPRLERIITRMMAKDPQQRYASAVELVEDLSMLGRARRRFQDIARNLREAFAESWWVKAAAALVLMGMVAAPPAWIYADRLEHWLGMSQLPDKKTIVVFKFQAAELSQAYADGLAEVLAGRLSALPGVDVVSTREVSESGIKKPSEAFRRLGANLAFTGDLYRRNDSFQVVLSLVDGKTGKILKQKDLTSRADSLTLQKEMTEAAVGLLKLELTAAQQAALGAPGTQNSSAHALFLEGKGYLASREPEKIDTAIALFQDALAEDPNFSLAYAGLGNAFALKFASTSGDGLLLERALRACDDAIRRGPNLAEGHICLAAVEERRGGYESSREEYERARELDPDNSEIWRGRARAYTALNNLEVAESSYLRAIKLNPDYWANYVFLGDFYLNARTQYTDALKSYQLAIDRAPDNPVPYFGSCGVHIQLGNYQDAVKACEKSVSLRPTVGGYINLGVAYFDLRQYPQAAQSFELANQMRPDYYKPVGHLARAYYWMGNHVEANRLYVKAIELAEEALAINPRGADIHAMLAIYHAMLGAGHHGQAFSHLNAALLAQPERPEYQCIAAVVHNQFDERSAAMRYLEKAIDFEYSRTEIKAQPELDNLREDPKFRALMEGQTARR